MTAGSRRAGGFTLIELAIVIIVSGLIELILFEALSYQSEQQKYQTTLDNISAVQSAISEYQGATGRYPCPAARDAAPNSAAYGAESATFVAPDTSNPTCTITPPSTAIAPGYDQVVANEVAIGAVPFAEIAPHLTYSKISNNLSLDGWGNRLTYAVTVSQTKAGTYRDDGGKVEVTDEHGKILILQPGTTSTPGGAHFVVLSHGDDGRGAYSKDGVQVQGCGTTIPNPNPQPGDPSSDETFNCNDLGAFLKGLRNLSQFSYNDDILKYTVVQRSDLWTVTSLTNNILRVVNTNKGKVGVGVAPATLQAAPYNYVPQQYNVLGAIQAVNFQTPQYCDQGGVNCMAPSFIGGPIATNVNTCPSGQIITSIADNQVNCGPAFTTSPTGSCPAGQYMVGISNLNHSKCLDPTTGSVTIN